MRVKIATQNRFRNSLKVVNLSNFCLHRLCKLVCVSLFSGALSSVYAGDFYTIIGPDGRPMVVQRELPQVPKKVERKETASAPTLKQVKPDHQPLLVDHQTEVERVKSPVSKSEKFEQNRTSPATLEVVDKSLKPHSLESQVRTEQSEVIPLLNKEKIQQNSTQRALIQPENTVNQNITQKVSSIPNAVEVEVNPSIQESSVASTHITTQQATKVLQKSPISELEGVQYVDHEYLESKEFNLEGRKRFYVIPEEGGGRVFGTVQREKGITKSMFERFMNHGYTNEESQTIALSSDYFRLDKSQVEASLEQRCFAGKQVEKAKVLGLKKDEIGLWPTEPLKEKFAYEIVKLDENVDQIQLISYSSSQKNPTYYWPFVVFLDQQGCVLEGVSGFKNESKSETNFQHSALAGILKKPTQASYLFMTPLAESIDVQNIKLSNQGQLKLSVLK